MSRAVDAFPLSAAVHTAALKLLADLLDCKGNRFVFEPSSVDSLLLFRDASRVLAAAGTRRPPAPSAL